MIPYRHLTPGRTCLGSVVDARPWYHFPGQQALRLERSRGIGGIHRYNHGVDGLTVAWGVEPPYPLGVRSGERLLQTVGVSVPMQQ